VELRGRTAIVTGGAGGIGTAISRRLAADGANVLVVDLYEPEDEAVRPSARTSRARTTSSR
jgi:NAD(P)-dependent dehydrogenase (short-subunit alcohol dehydrogenase family)